MGQSLTDVYNQVASKDVELEKQAAEMIKEAEEQDAAGRIMARGFADELAQLSKLAAPYSPMGTFDTQKRTGGPKPQGSVPSGGYQTGGGNTGANYDPFSKKRGAGAANAASMAGGGSANPVGAPPAKPAGGGGQSAAKPRIPKSPPLAAAGGSPRPPRI